MMGDYLTDIKEILTIMQKKPMSLFYGAGVCLDIGGPNGTQLLQAVKKQFPNCTSKDFFGYMNEVIAFDNSNRGEVEKWVSEQLLSISPNDDHKYLFSMPWRAILTTNYDRLPNLIPKTLDDRRLIIPVVNPDTDYPIDPSKPDLLYCFKLMGDTDYAYPNGGWMALSSRDLNLASLRRPQFFRAFQNLASSGNIIYIGYSFDDNMVFDLLSEMEYFLRSLPWKGYAISPTMPSSEVLSKMSRFNITWVKGTFEEFVEGAKTVFGAIPNSAPSIVSHFNIHNIPLTVERATASNIWGKFEILDVAHMEPFSKEPKSFLEGVDKSFYPFSAEWDFPRKTRLLRKDGQNANGREFSIVDFAKNRCRDANSSNNIIVALVGSAGSGKSVLSNRIAFNWYQTGNPVIFINTETLLIDYAALSTLLDEIWKNYQVAIKEQADGRVPKSIRFLLIADNCGGVLDQLVWLKNHLKAIGKPADILTVSRLSDTPVARLVNAKVDVITQIDDTVVRNEWIDFIDHFVEKNMADREVLVSNLNNSAINESFFALVYTSIHGVQKPLKTLILDEFMSLDADTQRVYGIVSLMQSQMLTPWVSLTTKSGKIDFDQLSAQIDSGPLGGVLQFGPGKNSIFAYNRVVADIISEYAYKKTDQLFLALRELIQAVAPNDALELRFLHVLLIERLESLLGQRLQNAQKLVLFQNGIDKSRSKPLLLHLAMLQIQDGKFDAAKGTLKDALEAHVRGFDEPDKHVIDVKGRLELRLAEKALKIGDKNDAWRNLENAEMFFKDAQTDPDSNPPPYQGLARTYLEKSKLALDKSTQWLYLLLAMQEITFVENYLGGEMRGMPAIKSEVLNILQSENLDYAKVQQINNQLGKAVGCAFLAEQEIRKGNFSLAFQQVTVGLQADPTCLWLIRLQVKLLRKLRPDDAASIRTALDKYVRIADQRFDVDLSFELAMELFKSGDYKSAMKLFHELEERTKNNPNRLTPLTENRWVEHGRPKEFLGFIEEAPRFGKYGKIHCTTLDSFYGTISIRPQDIGPLFGGERVAFEIIFNMSGPQASNVRKEAF